MKLTMWDVTAAVKRLRPGERVAFERAADGSVVFAAAAVVRDEVASEGLTDDLLPMGALAEMGIEAIPIGSAPVECVRCGLATGPTHRIDADHAGWLCPDCRASTGAAPAPRPPAPPGAWRRDEWG